MAEIKFEGIAKLNKGLKKRMDMSAVQTVVRKNGADMQKKAQRNAPVDTGTLKRSIGIDISDGGMTATVEPTAEYAPYVELGTRFMEAQPYLKPAFEEQKKQFEKDLLQDHALLIQNATIQFRKLHEEHQEAYQTWDQESKERVNKIMNATFSKSEEYLKECLNILKNNAKEEQEKTKQLFQTAINDAIAASVPRISAPLRDPLVKALIGTNAILGVGYIAILSFLL